VTDFLERLTIAVVPLVVAHALDVRKARVAAALAAPEPAPDSFAAHVRARRPR
jgi:hypothetical protein